MSTTTSHLVVVGRAHAGRPRTFRLQRVPASGSRNAAYRRLMATILGLDVAGLGAELRARRLGSAELAVRAA